MLKSFKSLADIEQAFPDEKAYLRAHTLFRQLRDDPRFQAMMRD